ncbi:Hydantoinase B/oxoprolinase-domain-containing protein [Massariosphaeria phaeospora]|uniref:Hydantoinase B/oxoprolinase-domain-containing protein n=1 Tax=Massariosphaeria phaeospora TaxID=100035 RepID=A0A7C8HYS6_9PLEO|nr:Hydantoinase B/oxoprolinase-domain-containing protein [Massariosphaeria phaeospora]
MAVPSDCMNKRVKIAIDRGGTFTDIWAHIEGEEDIVLKLLSVDPSNYDDAPTEGIRRVLSIARGVEVPRGTPLPKENLEYVRMGTTVATNALLERKGAKHALLVTKGLRDLLEIGYQSRPRLFDLNIVKPEVLYSEVREVEERVTIEGFDEDVFGVHKASDVIAGLLVEGSSGDMIRILTPLDERAVRATLRSLRSRGIDTVAVCFAHSYIYPNHEAHVGQLALEEGFSHVSLSSAVAANMIKMVPRGSSASADAYLTPEIKSYLKGFVAGFQDGHLDDVRTDFMQSDGGLVSHKSFSGLKGILSGPAGGVVGYSRTSYVPEINTPIVGLDMGGTSTDVSRYGGIFEHVFETTTAGVTIQSPQLDINTVAAGGGSILAWRNGLLTVGPESASSHPGPTCYRKGGPLAVTDANLFLGRLVPDFFPKIFGPSENEELDTDAVQNKFIELTKVINADTGKTMSPEEVAYGFLDVANEAMCRPIRALTEAKGYEIGKHNLAVFGGAGGQHACEIAAKLGIPQAIIHKYSSILSAYGMALADVVQEAQEPVNVTYVGSAIEELEARLDALRSTVKKALLNENIQTEDIYYEDYLNMRYQGTETAMMILRPARGDFKETFLEQHLREFNFVFSASRPILVDDVRIRGIGGSGNVTADADKLHYELRHTKFCHVEAAKVERQITTYFSGVGIVSTPVYLLENIQPGSMVPGPAMILDKTQSIVVVPGSQAKILTAHVVMDIPQSASIQTSSMTVDPIQLSVFAHRFMSIAEQMGRILQKTSMSLNIKERLDFSCAVFGPDGGLVANAPHVPVHLGSMSYAVKYQHELLQGELQPGDVLVSNHPEAGGAHLPDVTVITPVFSNRHEIAFYVASRGHHTDIGGLGGTSMPPNSTELWQEGAAIKSFRLIHDGKFDEEGIKKILTAPGDLPGCTPSRRLDDNLSDLKAQVAANNKGMMLIQALMEEYGQDVVQLYMRAIQENAEIAVRAYLRQTLEKKGAYFSGMDQMDNGSEMHLAVTIDSSGSATFDFTGTALEMYSNMNAPPSITYSAIIYSLRLLIGLDIPLNQGCLSPISIVLPKGSFLNPSSGAAVCAGNTQTSQRVVDVILKTFSAAAASHGCMNCLGFFGEVKNTDGTEHSYAFGETICGGSGATATAHGASAVHTHMTNTRITDPETLERRYPVILREFAIRKGSGGKGRFNGGDGAVRDIECRGPIRFSVITERRAIAPYGMQHGGCGAKGVNYWVKRVEKEDGEGFEERWVNMGSKNMVSMQKGDRCVIFTPGGGAWGLESDNDVVTGEADTGKIQYPRAAGSLAATVNAQAESN